MNLRKIKKLFKDFDGGVIKFIDQHKKGTYYFEIDYKTALPILKKLKTKKGFILLFSSDGNHKIYHTLSEVEKEFSQVDSLVEGSIFKTDKTYALAYSNLVYRLFENIDVGEKYLANDIQINIEYTSDNSYEESPNISVKPKKSNSLFTVKKQTKKRRFDWDEAYLEGLRIHGNIDDAESHADDEEYKFKHGQ